MNSDPRAPGAPRAPGRLLLIEGDPEISGYAQARLLGAGYEVVVEADGGKGLDLISREAFDLVLLDLARGHGIELCRRLRSFSDVPVILTAPLGQEGLIEALEAGADYFVEKPFAIPELVARIRAALRRSNGSRARTQAGALEIDPARYSVRKDGRDIPVTGTELRLLLELISAHGRVVSRQELLANVWNYNYLGGSRLVDMAIKRLRDKIEDDPKHPTMIQTVRGAGYRFVAP